MVIAVILSVSVFSGKITVEDGSYRTVAYMEEDGDITDGSYRTLGHLRGPVGVFEKRAAAALWLLGVLNLR